MRTIFSKNKAKEEENVRTVTPMFYPLPVDQLFLAPYQRGVRQSKVKLYADRYNPNIFGIILVSHRDGKYWIVDGQHRVEVAKLKGIKHVWCQVLEGLTYEQEAQHFYEINDSKSRLNANHKFHSKVEARDEQALNIVKALMRFGFGYSKEGNSHENGIINAVGTLQIIYNRLGYDNLCKLLEVIKKAWNGDYRSLSAEMLKGINTFMTNYTYDEKFLIKVLESDTPNGISDRARSYTRNVKSPKDGTCFHIAKTIRDMYEELSIKTKAAVAPCVCKVG